MDLQAGQSLLWRSNSNLHAYTSTLPSRSCGHLQRPALSPDAATRNSAGTEWQRHTRMVSRHRSVSPCRTRQLSKPVPTLTSPLLTLRVLAVKCALADKASPIAEAAGHVQDAAERLAPSLPVPILRRWALDCTISSLEATLWMRSRACGRGSANRILRGSSQSRGADPSALAAAGTEGGRPADRPSPQAALLVPADRCVAAATQGPLEEEQSIHRWVLEGLDILFAQCGLPSLGELAETRD